MAARRLIRDIYGPRPITTDLIRRIANREPPDEWARDVRDKKAGLILRHEKGGTLTLYANLGRLHRRRICDARKIIDPDSKWTLKMAQSKARKLKVQVDDGRDFRAEREAEKKIPTLAVYLSDHYKAYLLAENNKYAEDIVRRIEKRFSKFARTKIDQITKAKINIWRTERQKKEVNGRPIAAETVNRDIAELRSALSRAVKLELIQTNPLLGVEQARVDRRKQVVRAMTATEKEALIGALKSRDDEKREKRASANKWRAERKRKQMPPIATYADCLTPAVVLSLETGLRRGELLSLQWQSVDLKGKELRVEGATAKTFETRDIPLNSVAHKTLRDWWLQCGQPKDGLVFSIGGEKIGSLKKSYHAVLDAAGIKRVNRRGQRINWHSMRHTFGSLLGAANVDPTTLMKLMGHANLQTTQRYLHSDEDRKRAAVEKLQQQAN